MKDPVICPHCQKPIPAGFSRSVPRKYHPDCAEIIRRERINALYPERRSPKREAKK